MRKNYLALALTGALTLTMLAACTQTAGDVTPSATPTVSPTEIVSPQPTDTPPSTPTAQPDETPAPSETTAPSGSASPSASSKPPQSAQPSAKPSESTKPSQSTAPSESTKPEKSVVQSIWDEVSTQERPSLMDLDSELLSTLYGISAGDLVESIAKMPMMSANVTEFLIAKVAPGKMDAVKKACETRQASLASNTLYPEAVKLVEDYKLVTSGDYILFCIDEYAADMVTAFQTYAK